MILRSWWSWLQQKHNPDHPVHVLFRRSHIKYHWQLNWQIGLFNFPLVGGRPTPLKIVIVGWSEPTILIVHQVFANPNPKPEMFGPGLGRFPVQTIHPNGGIYIYIHVIYSYIYIYSCMLHRFHSFEAQKSTSLGLHWYHPQIGGEIFRICPWRSTCFKRP